MKRERAINNGITITRYALRQRTLIVTLLSQSSVQRELLFFAISSVTRLSFSISCLSDESIVCDVGTRERARQKYVQRGESHRLLQRAFSLAKIGACIRMHARAGDSVERFATRGGPTDTLPRFLKRLPLGEVRIMDKEKDSFGPWIRYHGRSFEPITQEGELR